MNKQQLIELVTLLPEDATEIMTEGGDLYFVTQHFPPKKEWRPAGSSIIRSQGFHPHSRYSVRVPR